MRKHFTMEAMHKVLHLASSTNNRLNVRSAVVMNSSLHNPLFPYFLLNPRVKMQ